jgi:hypothetical protein
MDPKEDIDLLDVKITRLKMEYEQYFMGILKREPLFLRGEAEKLIRHYSTKAITNTSLKFKYRSLVSKFTAYRQYWTRTLRAIEEGTYRRRAEGGMDRVSVLTPDLRAVDEDRLMKEVYRKYLAAREECHQPTKGLTLEKLKRGIEEQKKKIGNKYGTEDVDIKVYIKNGSAKLAVVPKKG